MTNPPGKRKTLTGGQKVYYEDQYDFVVNTPLWLWNSNTCFQQTLSSGTYTTDDNITFTFNGTIITSII